MHRTKQALHETPQARLRLVGAGAYSAPCGKDYPPHQHATWEAVYYRAGHIQCPIGTAIFEGRPGVLLATPPWTIHSEIALTAYQNYHIQIEAPAERGWPPIYLDDAEHTLGTLCGMLVREWSGHAPEREEMITLLLAQLDILLRRPAEQPECLAAERLVREVERQFQDRFSQPLVIKELAKEVGVSPSYLRVLFARLRGVTPLEQLHAVRVTQALGMIRNSNLSLEAIATLCGYNSASHLSRHIKRATGKSPGASRLSNHRIG